LNLKQQRIFRIIATIAYLLIILNGDMIGLPFFLWLSFTLFDFGNIDQLFAFLAVAGLTINLINANKQRTLKILLLDVMCFLLLAAPVIARLLEAPINLFNYAAFIIPTTVFVLFYLVSLYFACKEYFKNRNSANL